MVLDQPSFWFLEENLRFQILILCITLSRAPFFRRFAEAKMIGTSGRQRVAKDAFVNLELQLPPLPIQRRIASILGALDDKIELNLEMNKTLEEMAMALYKHWFVDFGPFRHPPSPPPGGNAEVEGGSDSLLEQGRDKKSLLEEGARRAGGVTSPQYGTGKFVESALGMIPEGWDVYNLQDVCDKIYSGGTPHTKNSEFWNGDIPWLSSGETRDSYIIKTDKYITELGFKKSSARMAYRGDTVIASAGQGKTRGQTSYLFLDTTINQSVLCLTANRNKISPGLLFYDLKGRYDQFRMISDSFSTRGSLTTKLIGDQIKLVLPKVEVQAEVAKNIDLWLLQIESNLKENMILTKLRDTLLPKLISGEIEVKEVEEEISKVV
jgi:type I restriction enzyme S subunit